VKGLDIDGHQIRVKAEDDLLAQALEHEVDHVNGILYVDRLDSPDDLVKLDGAGWESSGEQDDPSTADQSAEERSHDEAGPEDGA
jgi:peptide deformylase